jgi:hypothetical protein
VILISKPRDLRRLERFLGADLRAELNWARAIGLRHLRQAQPGIITVNLMLAASVMTVVPVFFAA